MSEIKIVKNDRLTFSDSKTAQGRMELCFSA